MLYSETSLFHDRRRLLLIAVGILVSSSLVSFSHGVSSSCHLPSSASLQGSSHSSFIMRKKPCFLNLITTALSYKQKIYWLLVEQIWKKDGFYFEGVRRQVLEGGNGTLVLAAERTRRPDPLNHFNIYTDGWNVTNYHYIAVSLL